MTNMLAQYLYKLRDCHPTIFGCIQDISRRSRQHDNAVCKGLEEMGLAGDKQERKQSLQSTNVYIPFYSQYVFSAWRDPVAVGVLGS